MEQRSGGSGGRVRARVPLIGLIGPIGSGKSTVAGILARLGAAVVDADEVTRQLMAPRMPLAEEIIARFGAEFRRTDGSLDRPALGRLVFSDQARLAELEAMTHPAVHARLAELVAGARAAHPGPRAIAIEAIRLVEVGFAAECDEVWLLVCDPAAQLARLTDRGMPEPDARQRIAAQLESMPVWRAAATRVVDTDGSLPDLEKRVAETFESVVGPQG